MLLIPFLSEDSQKLQEYDAVLQFISGSGDLFYQDASSSVKEILLKTTSLKLAVPPQSASPAPPAPKQSTKLRIPKPARIYVVGKSFLPTDNQQIFGVQGFFSRHDNLEPHVPAGAVWQGAMVFALSPEGFATVARSAIFSGSDCLYGPHLGAYYLDAVLLAPAGKDMMVFMIWEGGEAKTAREQIPGGTKL